MCYEINYLHGWRVLSAGVDMAEKLSLCFYMPVSQLVVKIGSLSAYRCSVYGAVHLRKVGRFPAISAHLRKESEGQSERKQGYNACRLLSRRSTPSEGVGDTGVLSTPSEGVMVDGCYLVGAKRQSPP